MCSIGSHIHAWNVAWGEWMKRDLAQPFYDRVERGSPIRGLDFASLIKGDMSWYFYEYYDGLYVVYMVVILLIFTSLLCWLYVYFKTRTMYGSQHFFTCM